MPLQDSNNKVHVTKEELLKIAESIIDTIIKKNADYGDAWQRYGIFTPLIRLNDKLLRVQTLSDGRKALVAGETIKDTILDIVAYGLLALLRMEWEDLPVKEPHHQPMLPIFNPEIIIQSMEPNETTKPD